MTYVNRRNALGAFGSVAALAGLGVAGVQRQSAANTVVRSQQAATPLNAKPLRIGYLPITDASALITAYETGILKRNGISAVRPVLFRSWESLAQAFLAGKLDAIHMLMPLAIQLKYAKNVDIQLLQWGHTNGSAITVAPSVKRLEDLAGHQVAIPFWWSVHNVVFQRLLRAHGLKAVVRQAASAKNGEIELVVMSPADMVAALATGSVKAYVVADPFCAVAEVKKVGKVFQFLGDVWRDHACCVVATSGELVREQPAVAQALSQSLVEAQHLLDSNRSTDAKILKKGYLPQPEKAINRVFTRTAKSPAMTVHHPDWAGYELGFSPYPFESYTRELVRTMRDTTIDGDTTFLQRINADTVHDEIFASQFVTRALSDFAAAHKVLPGEGIVPAALTRTEEVQT